jgi:hypothetical protein
MRFFVGCVLEEFNEYYKRNGFAGEQGTGEPGSTEARPHYKKTHIFL